MGISDKDCDIGMPAVFTERLVDVDTSQAEDIELSPYQTQLNQVYQIASPFLENIYGIRSSGDKSLLEMAEIAQRIDASMQAWNRNLPDSLKLRYYKDLQQSSSLATRLHQLQSLSLELTYQNLMIITHRPLLADWSQRRGRESRAQSIHDNTHLQHMPSSAQQSEVYDRSFQCCLTAALAISNLESAQPNLIRLAGKTHLVSFLGMNLFTSSVVLFICALSDVLSDAAQEAKRGIARNMKVLKSLSDAGSLSSQCSMVIEDLVQIIIDKERKQMLLGSSTNGGNLTVPDNRPSNVWRHDGNNSILVTNVRNVQDSEPPSDIAFWSSQNGSSTSLEQTMESLYKGKSSSKLHVSAPLMILRSIEGRSTPTCAVTNRDCTTSTGAQQRPRDRSAILDSRMARFKRV